MKSQFENENRYEQQNMYFAGWVTRGISLIITYMVSGVIAVLVTIVVIVGGLWLAYVYLPLSIFQVILAVLLIDFLGGLALRYFFKRRYRRGS